MRFSEWHRLSTEPIQFPTGIKSNALLYQKNHFAFVTELLKIVLTAKAPAWSYEQEGRIIRPTHGPYNVPRPTLIGITFGLRTPQEDEGLIRSLVSKHSGKVCFSRVVRTGSDFGIRVEDAAKAKGLR